MFVSSIHSFQERVSGNLLRMIRKRWECEMWTEWTQWVIEKSLQIVKNEKRRESQIVIERIYEWKKLIVN